MKNTIKIIFIFSTLILSACAKEKGTNIDASFSLYTDRFERLAKSLGRPVDMSNVTISFSDSLGNAPSGGTILGTCMKGGFGVPEIKINIEWWSTADYYGREQLVFHELGHCVLNRGHNDLPAKDQWGMNKNSSIMNSFHFNYYKDYYADYIIELFTGFVPQYMGYAKYIEIPDIEIPAGYYGDIVTAQAKTFSTVSKTTTDENGVEFETFGCGEETHDHE